jgi:hypothetical protein
MVIGGDVCWLHGGNASQVRDAREARILAWEAAAAGGDTEPRDPGEALMAPDTRIDATDLWSALRADRRQIRAFHSVSHTE